MSVSHNNAVPLLSPAALGRSIAKRGFIWQMDFLTPDKLRDFANSRGLVLGWPDIGKLCEYGLLRADYVVRNVTRRQAGFRYAGQQGDGTHIYADVRRLSAARIGRPASVPNATSHLSDGVLYFHKFRYLVLHQLATLLRVKKYVNLPASTSSENPFRPSVHHALSEVTVGGYSGWTFQDVESIDLWNDIVSLAVMSEPHMFTRIFGTMHYPGRISMAQMQSSRDEHWNDVVSIYQQIGLPRLQEIRDRLCWITRTIEPNEDVHTLLCLGGRESRLKLENALGGALLVRTMTEMIRRTAEEVFETQLPEEDVHPARFRAGAVNEDLYGSNRLLGDDWRAADEFARTFGLRFGHYVRWYVEGTTEYHAIRRLCDLLGVHDVGVINLRGVIDSKGFSAIREYLSTDCETRIFSFISIDGDRDDNVRVIRKAAKDDIFCGNFFIATPNFECCNFAKGELEAIVWLWALENGVTPDSYSSFQTAIAGWNYDAGAIDELFAKAGNALHVYGVFQKGKAWGEKLMDYAWQHPLLPDGTTRDIILGIRVLGRTRITNFNIMRRDYRIDEKTGDMVPRNG